MKTLSLTALSMMEGQQVIVHDLVYDEYDQLCIVMINRRIRHNSHKKKNNYEAICNKIWLENDEFKFEYNEDGTCKNGDFIVYSCRD